MKPAESIAAFEKEIVARGARLSHLSPRTGFEFMLRFFAMVEAEGCTEPLGDMLLFEWGTYDWGEGEHFELSISRQFIETGEEDEPSVSQLRLVFKYLGRAAWLPLGEGNRWCESRFEVSEFEQFIRENVAYVEAMKAEPVKVVLSHSYV